MIKVDNNTEGAADAGRMSTAYSNLDTSDDVVSHFLLQSNACLLNEDHEQEPPKMWWENAVGGEEEKQCR